MQEDIEAVIRTISELSEIENNNVQLRDRIISLLQDKEIENQLCCWSEFLDRIGQAVDAAKLNKECNSEEQSSKGSVHKDSHQSSNFKLPKMRWLSLVVTC